MTDAPGVDVVDVVDAVEVVDVVEVVDLVVTPLARSLLDGIEDGPEGTRREVDLVVLPCFEDERPLQGLAGLIDWRLSGELSSLLREGFCTGVAGEALMLPGRRTLPMKRLVLLGLGSSRTFDRDAAEATGARLVSLVERLAPDDVMVAMPGRVSDRAVVEAVFSGLIQALERSRSKLETQPAARAVGDEGGSTPRLEVAPAPDADSISPLRIDEDPGGRRWWVVADPRHEARLRRLLEGPPRAAEPG